MSESSPQTSKIPPALNAVLIVAGLWVQAVALHVFPIFTIGVCFLFAVPLPYVATFTYRRSFQGATPVADLGERGARLADAFAGIAAAHALAGASLHVASQEAVTATTNASWIPGTRQLVLTRDALALPDDEVLALARTEVFERRSRAFQGLRLVSLSTGVITTCVRVYLLTLTGLPVSLSAAAAIAVIAWCARKAILTSVPGALTWLGRRLDRQVAAESGDGGRSLRRVLVAMRDGIISSGASNATSERVREVLDARIERLPESSL